MLSTSRPSTRHPLFLYFQTSFRDIVLPLTRTESVDAFCCPAFDLVPVHGDAGSLWNIDESDLGASMADAGDSPVFGMLRVRNSYEEMKDGTFQSYCCLACSEDIRCQQKPLSIFKTSLSRAGSSGA